MTPNHSAKPVAWLVVGAVVGVCASTFWPSRPVAATVTDRNEKFALATCEVSIADGLEGVFVLDFLTGRLTGAVLNNKVGTFQYAYFRNLALDFQIDPNAEAQYAIVSGRANLPSRGRMTPANGVVYVAELNSGRVVAYAFPYRASNQAVPPTELIVVDTFAFREKAIE